MQRRAFTKIIGTATISAIAAPLFGTSVSNPNTPIYKLGKHTGLSVSFSSLDLENVLEEVSSGLKLSGTVLKSHSSCIAYDNTYVTQIDVFNLNGLPINSYIVFVDCSSMSKGRYVILNSLEMEGVFSLMKDAISLEDRRALLPRFTDNFKLLPRCKYFTKSGLMNIVVLADVDFSHVYAEHRDFNQNILSSSSVQISIEGNLYS
jgi:hypothetical protein